MDNDSRGWLSGPGMIGMFLFGPLFVVSALRLVTSPLRRYEARIAAVGKGLSEAAEVLAKFIGALAAGALGIVLVLFVIGGLVGLLLIGWRALTS